tara:strand:- start:126 stop:419 length:294 start_codon:yes stop_codon:yes gene_type:complete
VFIFLYLNKPAFTFSLPETQPINVQKTMNQVDQEQKQFEQSKTKQDSLNAWSIPSFSFFRCFLYSSSVALISLGGIIIYDNMKPCRVSHQSHGEFKL